MSEPIDNGSKNSTKERILDAAETLFSEHGFAETSMRDITKVADVNLASINYHFGSKEELINAVFMRCVKPLAEALRVNLEEMKDNITDESLDQSLRALVIAGLSSSRGMKGGGGIFIRLLSRAYADPEASIRNYLVKQHENVLTAYVHMLAQVLPDVSPEEIYWRAYYMLGSLMFVMSSETTLRNIARKEYDFHTSDEQVVEYLVKFLASGFRAK
ncbi:MAG: TetR family transcriptional regulator [Gammaproteobacteria bacterium]|nr:TetR family transcriptional regulator [Gammaproteobacteria bacterium]